MSSKKIIFLMPHPPTTDFQRKFFVPELKENNFLIEYWDIGSALGYDMNFPSDLKEINYLKIATLKILKEKMKQENETVAFVVQLTRNLQTLPIYVLLKSGKTKTIFFGRGYLPFVSQPRADLRTRLRKIFSNKKRLIPSLLSSVFFKFLPVIKKHDLTFVAGNLAERLHKVDSVRMAKIHHFDIDCSHGENSILSELPDNYCVFIDDFLPFHPDFSIQKNQMLNAENYYKNLNKFFAKIEKKLNTSIVIAAHPKASYIANPFESRAIVFGETNSLVKNAAVVLAHASTAISYAVIYEKPLCLLYSNDIKKIHPVIYHQMLVTAEILGCLILNFDETMVSSVKFDVDKTKYENYYKEFLSNEVNTTASFKIVIDDINSLLAANN